MITPKTTKYLCLEKPPSSNMISKVERVRLRNLELNFNISKSFKLYNVLMIHQVNIPVNIRDSSTYTFTGKALSPMLFTYCLVVIQTYRWTRSFDLQTSLAAVPDFVDINLQLLRQGKKTTVILGFAFSKFENFY